MCYDVVLQKAERNSCLKQHLNQNLFFNTFFIVLFLGECKQCHSLIFINFIADAVILVQDFDICLEILVMPLATQVVKSKVRRK